jgi:hypothetical protein
MTLPVSHLPLIRLQMLNLEMRLRKSSRAFLAHDRKINLAPQWGEFSNLLYFQKKTSKEAYP